MKKILVITFVLLQAFAQEQQATPPVKWKYTNESNLSIIQTGGNSNVETYDVKTENTFKKEKNEFNLGGHYILGESKVDDEDGNEIKQLTARNWDIHSKYNRKFGKYLGGFVSIKIEADEFAGYERRNNFDLGSRYTIDETDKYESYVELGLRYTEEKPVEESDEDQFYDNKGRVYYYVINRPGKQLTYKFWIEYVPNFSRPDDYLISTAPSITTTLTDVFSLQVSYKLDYDNEPAVEGNEYTDYTFTTSLVAKF